MTVTILYPIPVMDYISRMKPRAIDGLGRLLHLLEGHFNFNLMVFAYDFNDGKSLGVAVCNDNKESFPTDFMKTLNEIAFACGCSEIHVTWYSETDYIE